MKVTNKSSKLRLSKTGQSIDPIFLMLVKALVGCSVPNKATPILYRITLSQT